MCATKPLGDSRRQASCTRRSRRRTNMHRASARVGASWTRTVGAAVAMMQWRLRRGKRARSWMSSLHSWGQAAADSAEEGQTRRWQGPVPTPYMETRIQVCLLAPQLAVSWRLETFLTHLCDVAATRERRHQHPICSEPEPSEVRRGCCCFIDNLLGLVALSSPHRAPVDPFALRAGPPWLRGAPPGCWRWC